MLTVKLTWIWSLDIKPSYTPEVALFATPPFRNTFLTNLCFASWPPFCNTSLDQKDFRPENRQKWTKIILQKLYILVQGATTLKNTTSSNTRENLKIPHKYILVRCTVVPERLSDKEEMSFMKPLNIETYIGPKIIAWSPSPHQFFGCRITWPPL